MLARTSEGTPLNAPTHGEQSSSQIGLVLPGNLLDIRTSAFSRDGDSYIVCYRGVFTYIYDC